MDTVADDSSDGAVVGVDTDFRVAHSPCVAKAGVPCSLSAVHYRDFGEDAGHFYEEGTA